MSRTKKQAISNRPPVATSPTSESGWIWFLRRASIWLLAIAVAYTFEFLWAFSPRANQIDFSHYYVSALAMRRGVDPYITDLSPLAKSLGLEVAEMTTGTYPPTFILCFEPLTLLSPVPAYRVWTAMNLLFLAAALYLLLDGMPGDTDLRLALVGLAILYTPITSNFFYAQTQILILLLLTVFMRSLKSGRQALAGAVLGLAGLLKVFPLALIGYLILRRKSKAIVYTGLSLVLGLLVTLALVGVDRSLHFVHVVPFLTSPYWFARFDDVAIGAMVSRLLGADPADAGLEFARRAAVAIAELAIIALTVRATLKSAEQPDNSDDHVIALWVVAAILLSPIVWVHYLVLLLIPFAVLVRYRLHSGASRRARQLGIRSYMIAELLMAIYLWFGTLADWTQHLPYWTLYLSTGGWSLSLLLAYAAAYCLAVDTMSPHAASGGGPHRR